MTRQKLHAAEHVNAADRSQLASHPRGLKAWFVVFRRLISALDLET
jgi:hypothetical protein